MRAARRGKLSAPLEEVLLVAQKLIERESDTEEATARGCRDATGERRYVLPCNYKRDEVCSVPRDNENGGPHLGEVSTTD